MRPVRVTVGALGVSNPIILDHYQRPFSVGIGAALSAGASLTFSIEHTFDDVFAANFNPSTAVWYRIRVSQARRRRRPVTTLIR